jgi:hypothetical protein
MPRPRRPPGPDATTFQKKLYAQRLVNNLVRAGKLPRVTTLECVWCGRRAGTYHHDDYDYPEMVNPFCSWCHALWHSTGRWPSYRSIEKGP